MALSARLDHCMKTLAASPLFAGMERGELVGCLKLLHARCHTFERGELVQRVGEPFCEVGIVMSGVVEGSFDSEQYDHISMNRFSAGDAYGAAYACARTEASPIQLEAARKSEIVLLDVRNVLRGSGNARGWALDAVELGGEAAEARLRQTFLQNLLAMVSRQSTFLARKVRILSQKSLRDRIIVFLRGLPADNDGWRTVPFTQTAMAQFIGANRSALSRELGRMMDEGLLEEDGHRMRLAE